MAITDNLYFFAWVPEGTPWSSDLERYDEVIFDIEINQAEAGFATMKLQIRNPGQGLLAPGRERWAWVAWNDKTTNSVRPLFFGRLVAVPDDLAAELIDIDFRAEPSDYALLKEALAATLRELPYFDRAFLQSNIDDADTPLEARSAVYHTDRVTHEVTISDVLNGEDGTVEFNPEDMAYDGLKVTPSGAPKRRVDFKVIVTWQQSGTGTVDLTAELVDQFRFAGSPFAYPLIASYTTDGFAKDWPAPLTSIGAGWTTAADATIEAATWLDTWVYSKRWVDKVTPTEGAPSQFSDTSQYTSTGTVGSITSSIITPVGSGLATQHVVGRGTVDLFNTQWTTWHAGFPVAPYAPVFKFTYAADRKRTEILTFSLEADVQDVVTDAAGADVELVELNSDFVAQPVDPGGLLPIGNLASNTYFGTIRGGLSLEYFMLLGYAKLAWSSRVVSVKVEPLTWQKVWDLTCRKNALLHDPRLPGGQAIGKVTNIKLKGTDRGEMNSEVVIGCAVGYGNTLPTPPPVANSWAAGWSAGWTENAPGELIEVVPGQLQYNSPVGSIVLDDDGLNLFSMVPSNVLTSLVVLNGPNAQQAIIDQACKVTNNPDPVAALTAAPTRLQLQLVSVKGGPFQTEFPITVLPVVLPQGIDLEAPNNA